jgi:hypothetical protein
MNDDTILALGGFCGKELLGAEGIPGASANALAAVRG